MAITTLTGGNDVFVGVGGNADSIDGGAGNDILDGGNQSDFLVGGEGQDSLIGGNAADSLIGGNFNATTGVISDDFTRDYLIGNNQNDTVYAGQGDVAIGGNGTGTIYLPDGYTDSGQDSVVTYPTNTTGGTASASFNVYTSSSGSPIYVSGFQTFGTYSPAPCFASGTLIATARGEVAVEDLRVGDLVVTAHGGASLQPVVWIGHSKVDLTRHPARASIAPIVIKAGALASGVPHRDLRVSPDHAMLLDGHLVPAKHLVNGTSIVQEVWCPEVTYWHVELPAHGLLVSEGAVSESYFDDGNRKHFDNYGITTLFKDFESERGNGRYAANACRPLIREGEHLQRIRARIAERAAAAPGEKRRA